MIIMMSKYEVVRQGVGVVTNAFVASPNSTEDAKATALQMSVDFAVVDVDHYPTAVEELSAVIPVVVLTANASASAVLKAKRDGARGYVHMSQSVNDLLEAIEDARGGSPLDIKRVLKMVLNGNDLPPLCKLSERQLEVLQGLCTGQTAQEIADEMRLKVGTVRGYIQHIYAKIEVNNRVECVLWAVKEGMV